MSTLTMTSWPNQSRRHHKTCQWATDSMPVSFKTRSQLPLSPLTRLTCHTFYSTHPSIKEPIAIAINPSLILNDTSPPHPSLALCGFPIVAYLGRTVSIILVAQSPSLSNLDNFFYDGEPPTSKPLDSPAALPNFEDFFPEIEIKDRGEGLSGRIIDLTFDSSPKPIVPVASTSTARRAPPQPVLPARECSASSN